MQEHLGNQIPWGKLFAGAVRAGSGLPRDTIDAATSPSYTGRPVRRAWAQRPSCC
jgi:hypothetical protein